MRGLSFSGSVKERKREVVSNFIDLFYIKLSKKDKDHYIHAFCEFSTNSGKSYLISSAYITEKLIALLDDITYLIGYSPWTSCYGSFPGVSINFSGSFFSSFEALISLML